MENNTLQKAYNQLAKILPHTKRKELIAVASTIHYVSKAEPQLDQVNLQKLLRAEVNIKETLAEMIQAIEKEVQVLRGVFPYFNEIYNLESSKLTQAFYNFHEVFQMVTPNELMKTITWDTGKSETFSSPEVSRIAATILKAKGRLYDGTIGYADSALHIYETAKAVGESLEIYGQEINGKSWALAKVRLYIAGVEKENVIHGDVLENPGHVEGSELEKFDYVYMEPPFGLKMPGDQALTNDKYNRFFYGVPPKTSADFAFLSHALASMKPKGKGLVVVSDGALFRGTAEGKIRSNIIAADLVEAVISLPGGMYETTGIPVNLLLLNKSKPEAKKNMIQFITITEADLEGKRHKKTIKQEVIEEVVYLLEEGLAKDERSKVIQTKDLEDSILSPDRYVVQSKLIIEGIGEVHFDIDAIEKLETVTLKEHADFYRGFNLGAKQEESPDGEYQIIRLSDVQDGQVLTDQLPSYHIENKARIDMYRVKQGDVIVSIRGSYIKVAVIEKSMENVLLSQNFIGIRCKNGINPYYLKAFIESPVGQFILTNKMAGQLVATLKRKDIETLEIPLLPIEEQEKIIASYRQEKLEIEEKIQQLEQELKDNQEKLYKNMNLSSLFKM